MLRLTKLPLKQDSRQYLEGSHALVKLAALVLISPAGMGANGVVRGLPRQHGRGPTWLA